MTGHLPALLSLTLFYVIGGESLYGEKSREASFSYQQFLGLRARNSSLLEKTCNNLESHQDAGAVDWKRQLHYAVEKFHKDNIIIMTAGNWKYRGCTVNWMSWMYHHRLKSFVTLVYDEALLDYVGSWASLGHGVLVPGCSTKMEYATVKLFAMSYIVSRGFHVLWSDCDCVWLQPNIIETWIKPYVKMVDIIGQKGQFPIEISREKGITLCTGFMFIACSNATLKLLRLVLEDTQRMHVSSDQAVLNFALLAEGSYDFTAKLDYKQFDMIKSLDIPSYNSNISARMNNPPKIGFLPFPYFPRTRDHYEWDLIKAKYKPAIWHGNSYKIGVAKISGLKEAGVFLLKDNWESEMKIEINKH